MFRPLTVTAHLCGGFCASDPWSPSLDGILAWSWMRRHHPERLHEGAAIGGEMIEIDGLPLQRQDGETWWYFVSAPIVAAAARHRRHYHRRFDDEAALRHVDPRVGKVPVSAGPYKSSRLAETITVTDRITWHAMGEADGIRDLLRGVGQVGRGLARGFGRVDRWEVREDGDERTARFDRPLPVSFAAEAGVTGAIMRWGLRPPARVHSLPCVMPSRAHA